MPSSPVLSSHAESPATNLQWLGTVMCFVMATGGALAELGLAWVWLWPSHVQALIVPQIGLSSAAVSLDTQTRTYGFLVSMIPLAVLLFAMHQAYGLFNGYRLGQIFSTEAPVRLRRIGLCMVALGILRPLTNTALGLILTAHAPAGQQMLRIAVSLDDYMIAAFGGLVISIGHVMMAAARMADDHRQII